MRGVFIRGMKLPTSCGFCKFNASGCRCSITKSEIDRDYEYRFRLDDCPMTEHEEESVSFCPFDWSGAVFTG